MEVFLVLEVLVLEMFLFFGILNLLNVLIFGKLLIFDNLLTFGKLLIFGNLLIFGSLLNSLISPLSFWEPS